MARRVVLSSLAEAQAVYRNHCNEQRRAGRRRKAEAWISLQEKSLIVVVRCINNENGLSVAVPYEYGMSCPCAGIHEITD